MTVIIPDGFVQVGIQMRRSGDPQPWYVTYGINAEASTGDWETVALTIGTWWNDYLGPYYPTDTTISGVQLRVGTPSGVPLTLFYATDIVGLGSGQTLPQNCAVLITKNTFRPGRTGKGRFFWPTIIESEVNGLGQIDSAYRTTLNSAWTTLFGAHQSGVGGDPALPMYLLHNEGVPLGTTPTQIESLQVDPVISTQRRRLR